MEKQFTFEDDEEDWDSNEDSDDDEDWDSDEEGADSDEE